MLTRRDYLEQKYAARIEQKRAGAFNAICHYDPTGAHLKYAEPLLRWYLADKLQFEELPHIHKELGWYDRKKAGLPLHQRDILKIASPQALTEIVSPALPAEDRHVHFKHKYLGKIYGNHIEQILNADPALGHPHADWMARQHLAGKFTAGGSTHNEGAADALRRQP